MPVSVSPTDAAVGETGIDPCVRLHHIPAVDEDGVSTPAEPLHLGRDEVPVLLVAGENDDGVRSGEHGVEVLRESGRGVWYGLRVDPGVVDVDRGPGGDGGGVEGF